MRYNLILLRYGEIFLKSEPVLRKLEKILIKNIKLALKKEKIKFKILRKRTRIFIQTTQIKKASKILERIFGIVSFSPCFWLKTSDLKKIQNFFKKNQSKLIKPGQTFAIRARRVGVHPYTSQDLAKSIGSVIRRKVDLEDPDVEIFIEVRDKDSYIFTEVLKGPGGLPLGSSGKVICLISGGIDSAVAAWLLMKRGCEIFPLFASINKKSLKRFLEVFEELKKWYKGRKMKAFVFDHVPNLLEFKKNSPKYTCVLCKRMMLRIASILAKKLGAKAIVTGDSLGQVASQTLDNLEVINQASELPVLRPLIGMDKTEIIDLAKKIGTYEKSSVSVDCWAVPIKPATKASLEKIKEIEKKVRLNFLVSKTIKSLEQYE